MPIKAGIRSTEMPTQINKCGKVTESELKVLGLKSCWDAMWCPCARNINAILILVNTKEAVYGRD